MCDPGLHDGSERHMNQDDHSRAGNLPPRLGRSSTHGCAKRGGRPVTWIGGGGMDPKKLASLGVPTLRALFSEVFGEQTASNNACWLRRKLAESPDSVHGQRRSPVVRARDMGAAIWNPGCPALVVTTGAMPGPDCEDEGEGPGEQEEGTATTTGAGHQDPQGEADVRSCSSLFSRRSLKRSAASADSADTLGYHGSLAGGARLSPAPSGSGSASLSAGSSPRRRPVSQQRQRGSGHTAAQQQESQGCRISPDSFNDGFLGVKVAVFWPADNQWWPATICKLNTAAAEMQLLYADMTEEAVSGADFWELLSNGHLLLASAGQCPPSSTGLLQAGEACQSQQQLAWPVDAAGGSWLCPSRSQSCLLPRVTCDPVAHQELCRSASVGTGSDSRRSASGSGAEGDELAAKRQRCELSATTFGSGVAASDRFAFPSGGEQPPGSDASNLGAWFASQQRQQLELQQQVPNNMQCQQQAQMQMHQQMAAHMQMQQVGHYMHLEMPALAAPGSCGAGAPPVSAFAAAQDQPGRATAAPGVDATATHAPTRLVPQPSSSLSPEGSCGLAEEIRQLKQLHLRLQQAVAQPDVAASCWLSLQLGPAAAPGSSSPAAVPSSPAAAQQQSCHGGGGGLAGEPGLSVLVPAAGCGSLTGSAAGSPVAALRRPELLTADGAVVPGAGPQQACPDAIDALLAKQQQEEEEDGLFCMGGLGCDMGDGEGLAESFGGPTSSSGGGSLCESVADELAVAGLGADDAPCYYSLFGGGGDGSGGGCQAGDGPASAPAASAGAELAESAGRAVSAADQAEQEAFAHMFDDLC